MKKVMEKKIKIIKNYEKCFLFIKIFVPEISKYLQFPNSNGQMKLD